MLRAAAAHALVHAPVALRRGSGGNQVASALQIEAVAEALAGPGNTAQVAQLFGHAGGLRTLCVLVLLPFGLSFTLAFAFLAFSGCAAAAIGIGYRSGARPIPLPGRPRSAGWTGRRWSMTMGSAQLSRTSSSSGLLPVLSGLHPSRHCREMIVQSSLSARTTCQHVPRSLRGGTGLLRTREILSHESLVYGEIK